MSFIVSDNVTTLTIGDAIAEVLANDGVGSGLDADLLDGLNGAAYAAAAHSHSHDMDLTGVSADDHHAQAHDHTGADGTPKLTQARSHESPDTDTASTALHHTLGTGANQAAAGTKGVTNGDTHDHNGGDGAQISHANLSNIGTNTHAQIDTHISAEPFDAHANNPAARAYHNAHQSIANATAVALALNSERFDTDAIHDTVTNNSRLTCKTAGKYQISGALFFAANATGYRYTALRLNGATLIAAHEMMAVTGAGEGTGLTLGALYDLAVNDYVEMVVNQNSGGALNILAFPNTSPEFSMVRVG